MPNHIHNKTALREAAILRRLQDAAEGKNSFRTSWSTHRVITKAAEIHSLTAIPWICMLAEKGEEIQLYAALHALVTLKAREAESLFRKYATDTTQKEHIRHLATEDLLTILADSSLEVFTGTLLARLPSILRQDIQDKEETNLLQLLEFYTNNAHTDFFTELYLLAKPHPWLLSPLQAVLRKWECEVPFFKQIRAMYRLAEIRKDYPTLSCLARLIEKKPAFNQRSSYYEVRAFSPRTKRYFQQEAWKLLKRAGESGDARAYLEIALAFLLQYDNKDYIPEQDVPLSQYAQRDPLTRKKYFLVNHQPECYKSFLLSTILFGKDPERRLTDKFLYTYHPPTRKIYTKFNYYNEMVLYQTGDEPQKYAAETQPDSLLGGLVKYLYGVYKKKKQPQAGPAPVEERKEEQEKEKWFELFPEHWEAFPETYIKLLKQAKMDLVHQFAYNRLKKHSRYEEICTQVSWKEIILLLDSSYEIPRTFGLDLLKTQAGTLSPEPGILCGLLERDSIEIRTWAREQIIQHFSVLSADTSFLAWLIVYPSTNTTDWIDRLLRHLRLSDEQQQTLPEAVLTRLTTLPDTSESREAVRTATKRIKDLSGSYLYKLEWELIDSLLSSPLDANQLLASEITAEKSARVSASDVPPALAGKLLRSPLPAVRDNGLRLISRYPDSVLAAQSDFLLQQTDNPNKEVVTQILERLRRLASYHPSLRNALTRNILTRLVQPEAFEGAHTILREFFTRELQSYWNQTLTARDQEFTLEQVISFGEHPLPEAREWCRNYFRQNSSRIRIEKKKAIALATSSQEETRLYARQFFTNHFSAGDWEPGMLVYLLESSYTDVREFGQELVRAYLPPAQMAGFLLMQSEHPDLHVRISLLEQLLPQASGKKEILAALRPFFRSILFSRQKVGTAKKQVITFLHTESCRDPEIAWLLIPLLEEVSLLPGIREKEKAIYALTEIKNRYPGLEMQLIIKE